MRPVTKNDSTYMRLIPLETLACKGKKMPRAFRFIAEAAEMIGAIGRAHSVDAERPACNRHPHRMHVSVGRHFHRERYIPLDIARQKRADQILIRDAFKRTVHPQHLFAHMT